MDKRSLGIQYEFPKPSGPRPRQPLRINNVNEKWDPSTFRNLENSFTNANMYKDMYAYKPYHTCKDESEYTDDEEDLEIEKEDQDNSMNKILNTTSNSSLNSTSTPYNSPTVLNRQKRHTASPVATLLGSSNESLSVKAQNHNVNSSVKYISHQHIIWAVIAIPLIVFFCSVFFHKEKQVINDHVKVECIEANNMLDKSMRTIRKKFNNQKISIWNDIAAAIYDTVLFPKKPSIIILFGNGTDTLNCLANLLGELSAKILGSKDHLTLTPKDFPNDVGRTIHKFKEQILDKRAVVVQDLLNINVEAIRAFHNFCDRESPLVQHAIYILTVILDNYQPTQREIEFVERQIFKRLSNSINKDILVPLVTRLTDGIIVPVVPEATTNFNHADCSLLIKR